MTLLLAETNDHNILHVMQGPESELQYAVHGNITVNISTLLAQMNGEKPVLLYFTRCDSEMEKQAHLAAMAAQGKQYPFAARTAVFGPKAALEAAVKLSEATAKQDEDDEPVAAIGKCGRCGCDANLVPGLLPNICYNCAKIDLGVAAGRAKVEKK